MERPSLDRYREILEEEGIDLPEEELRALREQVELLAEVVVDLYLESRRGGADTVSGARTARRSREAEPWRLG